MFMRWGGQILGMALVVTLLVSAAGVAEAGVTDVTWSGSDGTLVGLGAGTNSASDAVTTMSVSAQSIRLFTTTSGGSPTGHYGIIDDFGGTYSGSITYSIDIQVGGTWHQVWTGTLNTAIGTGLQTVPLGGNVGPINFGMGLVTVTGLRFNATAQPTTVGGWGSLRNSGNTNGDTVIRFDTEPSPEPLTLLLVGAGIGGLALHRRRLRRGTMSRDS